ncbi:metallophosphoesterase family protein [Teredinibacter franksiae]|uniref:metallophosphoesterase family protein n=1 Tax=Teredinibacter franksiae TaxID=2761453 RepID=UPI001625F8F6|nr:metallophosphoesterase [Teredinibacter franksiae]
MTMLMRVVLLMLVCASISACKQKVDEGPLRVAFLSHTYHLHTHKDIQAMLVDSINKANPKYIFSLGDVVLVNDAYRWEHAKAFHSGFMSPVYYSPGNHDLHSFYEVESLETNRHYPQRRQEYIDQIGYVNKHVQDDRADFILFNSNDPYVTTKPFLDQAIASANPDTPNFMLTHHPIWIDRFGKNWIQWYWKSIKREEVAPHLKDYKRIVVGDVSGRIQNHEFDDTPVTMVGIGNDGDPIFWVLATLQENGDFTFEEQHIQLPLNHPYLKKKH